VKKKKIRDKADYKKVEDIAKISKTLFKSRNPSRISRGMRAERREKREQRDERKALT
jgi:hypothetical protein